MATKYINTEFEAVGGLNLSTIADGSALSNNETKALFLDANGDIGYRTVGTAAFASSGDYVSSSNLNDYLPLAGGTMTGALQVATAGASGINLKADTSNSNTSSRLFFSNGTSGEGVSIYNGDNKMMFQTGATFNSSTGSTRMTILASGNVGIGTTSPSTKLHVDGNIRVGDANDVIYSNRFYTLSNANLLFAANTGYDTIFQNGGSERMRIKTGGAVGIGTNNPDEKLEIFSSGDVGLRIHKSSVGELRMGIAGTAGADAVQFVTNTTGFDFRGDSNTFPNGGSSRLFISSSGSVGVNTTSPSSTLDVNGTLTADVGHFGTTGSNPQIQIYTQDASTSIADTFTDTTTDKSYIYFQPGTSSNDPGYIMHETSESETNEGVIHLAPSDDNADADYVSIHGTNDADALRLTTAGLIETASNYQLRLQSGSGAVKVNDDFEVTGNVGIGVATPNANLHVYNTGNGEIEVERASGALVNIQAQSAKGVIGTDSNHPLSLKTNASERLTINSSGNVGIGTTTPAKQLHVRGSAPFIRIEEDSASNKRLDFWVDPSTAIGYVGANQSAQQLSFQTGNTDRIRITNGGNVGIGTTSPSNTLDINGGLEVNAEAYIRSTSNVGLRIQTTDQGITSTDGLRVGLNATHAFVWQYENLPLAFATNGSERATILANGNFGIGDTTPSYKLDVAGTLRTTGEANFNSNVNVTGDLKMIGTDSYIWTPNTTSGYTGFWDQANSRLAMQYRNSYGGWGIMGAAVNGIALKVYGTSTTTGAATFDSDVTIGGNLEVQGTTTYINTTNLQVEDSNIELGKLDGTTPSNSSANNGGITLLGGDDGDKKLTWTGSSNSWIFNTNLDVQGDFAATGSVRSEGPDGGMVMRSWTNSSGYGMIGTANMSGSEYALLTNGTDTYISGGSGGSVYLRGGGNDTSPQLLVTTSNIVLNGLPNNTTEATAVLRDDSGNLSYRELGTAAFSDTTDFAAASHTHSYLPLSGGTLTGNVTFPSPDAINFASNSDTGESHGITARRTWKKGVAAGYLQKLGYWTDTEGTAQLLITVGSETSGNSATSTYLWGGGFSELSNYARLLPLTDQNGHGNGPDTGQNDSYYVYIYPVSAYVYGVAVAVPSGASNKTLRVTVTELAGGNNFTDDSSGSAISLSSITTVADQYSLNTVNIKDAIYLGGNRKDSNWDTAYGWGDHASQNYLTSNQTITLDGDVTGSGTTSITTSIATSAVGANELNVSGNGTTAQFLRSDGDGTFTWATPTNTTYSTATSSTLGLVKIGYTENNKNYPVELSNGQMFVNVPWSDTDTNTTYTPGNGLTLDATEFNVTEATSSAIGGIKLFSNTDQSVAANAVTSTSGRTYGVQLNSSGQAVVNVPWSDTNTVYTHPTHPGDDINIDTGALTGATVISDLDFNITTDTLGHVTDANATVSTRTLTLSDLGYTPYSHPTHPGDDFSVDSGPLTGATVISDIDINVTTDTLGHVTDANGTIATRTLTAANLGISAPNAPSNVSVSVVGETVSVSFDASTTSGIDSYLVYSSVDGSDYGLISIIPPDDFSATMEIIDQAFTVTGTQAYRVYAMKYGIMSSAATGSVSYTVSSAEPTDMTVVPLNNAYFVQWNPPSSNERFVTAYNVYKHEAGGASQLSRASASLVYSGLNTNFMYQISGNNNNNYHQFWVETSIA